MPTTQYNYRDWVTEEAHLVVFDALP